MSFDYENDPRFAEIVKRFAHDVMKDIKPPHKLVISREYWERLAIDCKEMVIAELNVPDEEMDAVMYENNTIWPMLADELLRQGAVFEKGAVRWN